MTGGGLVSVVTPCYNGEKYIGRFFDSVLSQTYKEIEVVAINDGSTDRTEQVIQEYEKEFQTRGIALIHRYQENAGQAAALNNGLKLFTGEYLLWVDSDDELSDTFIEERVTYLYNHPEKSYCYGKAVYVSEDNPDVVISETKPRKYSGEHQFFEDIINVRDVFFSGYLCRTEALNRVIRNRDIFSGAGGQNAQLLLPLAWYYGEPGYVDSSVYKYYVRANSHSHSQNTNLKIIEQLERYEAILVETISRIQDEQARAYIPQIRKKYARLRFGNAVDTRDQFIIRKHYSQLKKLGIVEFHDTLMLLKYSLPLYRKG